MVYVGRPVADLIRWNAEQGEMGPGDPAQQVQKRLAHIAGPEPPTHINARAATGRCTAFTANR